MRSDPLEKEIEEAVGRYAKSKGCLYYKFTSPNRRSVPDRLIIAPNGRIGFLELKRKDEEPTEAQRREMLRLTSHMCEVDWTDNVAGGRAFVDKLIGGKEDWV